MKRKTLNKKSKIQKSKRNIKTLKKSKKKTRKTKKNYKTKNKNTRSKKKRGGDVNSDLATASQRGNLLIVQALLKDNLFGVDDINEYAENSNDQIIGTPLYLASENGHLDVVKELITHRAYINKGTDYGATPLLAASVNGHVNVVNVLLDNRALIDQAENNAGNTPLHGASWYGYVDVVRALVEDGADVTIGDKNGDTPLHIASAEGFLDVVKALYQGGANINQRNNDQDTPVSTAAHNGRLEVVRYLMEMGADIDMADNNDMKPIELAAEEGHINVVNLLVPKMTEEEFSQCEKNDEQKVACGISFEELNRENAVLPEVVQTEEDTRKRKKTSNQCFDRSAFQKWLRRAEENSDSDDDEPPPQPKHPYTNQLIDRNWINKWYPLGVGEGAVYSVPTGGKRKKKKNTTRKKKRGAGPGCSRPQVIEDNESNYSDGSNPDPVVAEIMQDNEPLPPGAQRFPTVQYPSTSAERVPEIPIVSTEISLDTDNTPDLKAYNPALYTTKLSKTTAHSLYNMIYNTGRIEEDTKEIEDEFIDALRSYVYHVNYFDTFSADYHGNPNKIGDSRELYIQVYHLIGAWNKYDGEIEDLLGALRSDPDTKIGF